MQSPSNLQVTRTGIKSRTSSNYTRSDHSFWSYMPLSGGKKWCSFSVSSYSNLLATRTGIISVEFKFQLDRTAGFTVKCHWVPKHFLVWCFCYMQKPVLILVPVPVVSTVPTKVVWSFELYLYLELTVPQVSDCCPLGWLVLVLSCGGSYENHQISSDLTFSLYQSIMQKL